MCVVYSRACYTFRASFLVLIHTIVWSTPNEITHINREIKLENTAARE